MACFLFELGPNTNVTARSYRITLRSLLRAEKESRGKEMGGVLCTPFYTISDREGSEKAGSYGTNYTLSFLFYTKSRLGSFYQKMQAGL